MVGKNLIAVSMIVEAVARLHLPGTLTSLLPGEINNGWLKFVQW